MPENQYRIETHEASYRRGFVHGLCLADDMLRLSKKETEKLHLMIDFAMKMRYELKPLLAFGDEFMQRFNRGERA
jgi:hypothetical protein